MTYNNLLRTMSVNLIVKLKWTSSAFSNIDFLLLIRLEVPVDMRIFRMSLDFGCCQGRRSFIAMSTFVSISRVALFQRRKGTLNMSHQRPACVRIGSHGWRKTERSPTPLSVASQPVIEAVTIACNARPTCQMVGGRCNCEAAVDRWKKLETKRISLRLLTNATYASVTLSLRCHMSGGSLTGRRFSLQVFL